MLIRREAIKAALAATTQNDTTRYFPHAVQLEPDGRVVGTNGHVLIVAKDKEKGMPDGDFPIVPGAPFRGSPKAPVLLPADLAERLLASIPKTNRIACLSAVQVSIGEPATHTTIAATDLTMPAVVTIDPSAEGTFPKYDRVIPSADRAAVRVTLSVEVLQTILKAAAAIVSRKTQYGGMVTFTVPTACQSIKGKDAGMVLDALTFTINGADVDVTGVAMPCCQ